jgi:hypothetical protein
LGTQSGSVSGHCSPKTQADFSWQSPSNGDLVKEEKFRDLTVSQVSYHLARLQDAELVPVAAGG